MITIKIQNMYSYIEGQAFKEDAREKLFHEQIRTACAYEMENAKYSEAYRNHTWDGLISLYNKRHKYFPTGLISDVVSLLKEKEIEFKLEDSRIVPVPTHTITQNFSNYGRVLHDYQQLASDIAWKRKRGIIAIATGGGKTMVACDIIARISVTPMMFIVPSKSLLKQTHHELCKYLSVDGQPAKIGMIGDNICEIEPDGINICTYQTALTAFDEKYIASKNKIEKTNLLNTKQKTLQDLEKEHKYFLNKFNASVTAIESKLANKLKEINRIADDLEFGIITNANEKKEQTRLLKSLEKQYNLEKKLYLRDSQKSLNAASSALLKAQTIFHNKQNIRDLFANVACLMVDEAHIATAIIQSLCEHSENAYYRYGLSATPWREDNQEKVIEGCFNKKIIEVSASYLIDHGFLVNALILMATINHYEKCDDYIDSYNKNIINNWERNLRIKQFAEKFKSENRPVMIICDRIEHGRLLSELINDSVFVPGSEQGEDDEDDEEKDYRKRMLNDCEKNKIILIGTQWMNTGIDAPAISVLILAGSIKSSATTLQAIGRVLRLSNGKTEAVILDFMDKDPIMKKHSLIRKRVYESEKSFKVHVL